MYCGSENVECENVESQTNDEISFRGEVCIESIANEHRNNSFERKCMQANFQEKRKSKSVDFSLPTFTRTGIRQTWCLFGRTVHPTLSQSPQSVSALPNNHGPKPSGLSKNKAKANPTREKYQTHPQRCRVNPHFIRSVPLRPGPPSSRAPESKAQVHPTFPPNRLHPTSSH